MIRARNGIYERQLQHQQRHNERYQPELQRNQNYNNSSRATLLNAIEEQQQQQQQLPPYRRLAPTNDEADDIADRYSGAHDDTAEAEDEDEEYGIATTTTTTTSSAAAYTASTRSLRHERDEQRQLSKDTAKAKRAPPNGHLQSPFTIDGGGGGGAGGGVGAMAANFHTKWQQRQPLHDQTTTPPHGRGQQQQPQQQPQHSTAHDDVGQRERGDGIAIGVRRIRRPRQWLTQQQRQQLQLQQQQQQYVDDNDDVDASAPMQQQRQRQRQHQHQHQQQQKPNATTANSGEDNESHITTGDGGGKRNYVTKGKAFIIEFLQGSSIHGFIYLAKMGLNFVERILWFAFICVALFSIISLSKRTWERFQTSPTVISMDRNKLVWNTSFPSLTVCPHKRIDELKVDDYIATHTELFENEDDEDLFRDFIVKLASLTYENIETLPINKSFGIPGEQYLDLIYELKWNFEPEISSGAAVQMFIYETLTEFGICHSVNSLVARYNSISYWKNNDWSFLDHGDRVTVHPLDGEIYAQIINLSTAYDVYFHGAGDVPNISKQRYTFPESDYTTVELIALEIYTNDAARAFTTKQRKCRFQHEADDMQTVPIYSFGLCLAECRMFFTLKVCGCVPHFYRNRLKSGRVLPICGFQGLRCIADIKREVITLKSERYKIDCNCLSNCDDSNFFVQSYRSRVWFLGANLQWGIIDYPKMQLRRDVLFSFADVLVYIGGLVGFFLGCSALSFTEIIYYFTARLVRRMFFN